VNLSELYHKARVASEALVGQNRAENLSQQQVHRLVREALRECARAGWLSEKGKAEAREVIGDDLAGPQLRKRAEVAALFNGRRG
jgi:hypothetical protein